MTITGDVTGDVLGDVTKPLIAGVDEPIPIHELNSDFVTLDAGINVKTWLDQSPSGIDVDSLTASKQPVQNLNALNGHAEIVFDGLNDEFRKANVELPIDPNNITIFTVDRVDLYSQNAGLYSWRTNDLAILASTGASKAMIWDYGNTTSNDSRIITGSLAAFEGLWKITTLTSRSDDTGEVRINGSVIASNSNLSATITGTIGTLIVGTTSAGREYIGAMARIIVYAGSLSAAKIDEIENSLNDEYNLGVL